MDRCCRLDGFGKIILLVIISLRPIVAIAAEIEEKSTGIQEDKKEIITALQHFLDACRRHDNKAAKALWLDGNAGERPPSSFPAVDSYEILSIDERQREGGKFSDYMASEHAFNDNYAKSLESFRGDRVYILRKEYPLYMETSAVAVRTKREKFDVILAQDRAFKRNPENNTEITESQHKFITTYGNIRTIGGISAYYFDADRVRAEIMPDRWLTLDEACKSMVPSPGIFFRIGQEDFLDLRLTTKLEDSTDRKPNEIDELLEKASYCFDYARAFCRLGLIGNDGLIRQYRVRIGLARLRFDNGDDTGWLLFKLKKVVEHNL